MDEPCSALDPLSTGRIEELILAMKPQLPIVIVTHNLAQARGSPTSRSFSMTGSLSSRIRPNESSHTQGTNGCATSSPERWDNPMNDRKPQRAVICLYDGFGYDYYERSELPVMKGMAVKGLE